MAGTGQLSHIWTTSVKNDTGGNVVADTRTIIGSNEFNELITIGAGLTAEIDCGSLAFAKMTSLFLTSDVAVNVFTNAADGTGGQVIALAAKVAYGWNNKEPTTNPITANITKIFVTNPGATTATFRCGFLLNLLV